MAVYMGVAGDGIASFVFHSVCEHTNGFVDINHHKSPQFTDVIRVERRHGDG
jgi:hypothetical protein